jgi:hypothetical protein
VAALAAAAGPVVVARDAIGQHGRMIGPPERLDAGPVVLRRHVADTASAAVPRKLGFRLDRVEKRPAAAPGETGRQMIWVSAPPAETLRCGDG